MDNTHTKPASKNRLYRLMIVSIACVSIACWITIVLGIYYPDLSSMSELCEKLINFPLIADILHFFSVIVQYATFFSAFISSILYMLKFALFAIFGFLIAQRQGCKQKRNILRLYSLSFLLAFICYTYGLLLRMPSIEVLQIDSIVMGLFFISTTLIIITTVLIYVFKYETKVKIVGAVLSILVVINFISINISFPLGWLYTAIIEGSIATMQLVLFAMISSYKLLKDSSTPSLSSS